MKSIILVIGVVLLLSIFVYSYAAEKPVSSQPKKPAAQAQQGPVEPKPPTPQKEGAGVHLTVTQEVTENIEQPPESPDLASVPKKKGEEKISQTTEGLVPHEPIASNDQLQTLNIKPKAKEAPKP